MTPGELDELDDFCSAVLADNRPRSGEPFDTIFKWLRVAMKRATNAELRTDTPRTVEGASALGDQTGAPDRVEVGRDDPLYSIGTRCKLCRTAAPEAFARECNRPECPHRAPVAGEVARLREALRRVANEYRGSGNGERQMFEIARTALAEEGSNVAGPR